jgi:hypothetical protein
LKSIRGWLETGQAPEPEKVYEMVKKAWKTYIEFSDEVIYDFLTLWTIGTYFFHLFNSYPYIYIGGLKQTGKTKVLTVASLMCFNAISSNNLSTPSIFRLIQSGRCTLLMDETEKLVNKERASELRNLLLSGYKKGMKVYRTEKTRGEKLVPEAFEVYSPKMIANIYGLEDVLEDRCILIIMRRAKNAEIGNREPKADDQIWQDIRDCLYTFCLSYWQKISECYERSEGSEPTEYNISERDYELWKPILALAKFFSFTSVASQHAHPTQPTLFDKILRFAKEKVEEKKVENITETGEYVLVQTLLKIVNESSFYKVKAIKGAMAENYDEEQKWLTTEWIGRALKRLGFTEKRRVGTGVEYNLSKEAVLDLAERLQVKLEKQEDEQPILVSVKSWCLANRNEMGEISLTELAEFITKELKQDPKHVVTTAFNQGILMPSNKPGLMVVV